MGGGPRAVILTQGVKHDGRFNYVITKLIQLYVFHKLWFLYTIYSTTKFIVVPFQLNFGFAVKMKKCYESVFFFSFKQGKRDNILRTREVRRLEKDKNHCPRGRH